MTSIPIEQETSLYWPGDEIRSNVTVAALIAAEKNWPTMTPEETLAADKFFSGEQWDEQLRDRRMDEGRPCLVINRLPGLAACAIQASNDAGQPITELDKAILRIVLVRRNGDAQRFYNFMASAIAERTTLPPQVMLSPESILWQKDGVTYVKPPRSGHHSFLVRWMDRLTRWIDPKA
jgi:hypothetical protein